MKLLDTDTLTLFVTGNPNVVHHALSETDVIGITIITRIEVLRGRFDALLKAADGPRLSAAQRRLITTEQDLQRLQTVNFDASSASVFDDLRQQRKLRRIGRADLLIASIVLAQRATLVTRNLKHFRQVPGLSVENWAD
jgi:tRNA(fMet)-specific endonuclease VapC